MVSQYIPKPLLGLPRPRNEQERDRRVKEVRWKEVVPIAQNLVKQNRAAYRIASIYAQFYSRYYQCKSLDWQKIIEEERGKLALASRAAAVADQCNAIYKEFIEAQFYWITNKFERAPYWSELGSYGSSLRYYWWKEKENSGELPAFKVHPAILEQIELPINLQLKHEEKILKYMIHQWGSEQVVWELCGSPEDNEVFSLEFKKTRPIWRKMYENNQ